MPKQPLQVGQLHASLDIAGSKAVPQAVRAVCLAQRRQRGVADDALHLPHSQPPLSPSEERAGLAPA